MSATHEDGGYWLLGADGGISTSVTVPSHDSTGNIRLNEPVDGIAVAPNGAGFTLVGPDGGVFTNGSGPPRNRTDHSMGLE
jgi:hypothetical protein